VPATRLCVIRHGETAWNSERRIQGQLDEPLSALGHAQARATADSLAQEAFAAIYASDLSRARQTAEAVAHLLKLPVRLEPDLRERHYGVFQKRTYDEMRKDYPREYARFEAREIDFVLPGGESLRRFSERVLRCFGEIVERHAGGQVLVFTHGGVLDILHRRASGKPLSAPRDFEIPNAALNWLEVADGKWSTLIWADRGHLAEALDELPG
jgi:probable phosphoglycerate mutase